MDSTHIVGTERLLTYLETLRQAHSFIAAWYGSYSLDFQKFSFCIHRSRYICITRNGDWLWWGMTSDNAWWDTCVECYVNSLQRPSISFASRGRLWHTYLETDWTTAVRTQILCPYLKRGKQICHICEVFTRFSLGLAKGFVYHLHQ